MLYMLHFCLYGMILKQIVGTAFGLPNEIQNDWVYRRRSKPERRRSMPVHSSGRNVYRNGDRYPETEQNVHAPSWPRQFKPSKHKRQVGMDWYLENIATSPTGQEDKVADESPVIETAQTNVKNEQISNLNTSNRKQHQYQLSFASDKYNVGQVMQVPNQNGNDPSFNTREDNQASVFNGPGGPRIGNFPVQAGFAPPNLLNGPHPGFGPGRGPGPGINSGIPPGFGPGWGPNGPGMPPGFRPGMGPRPPFNYGMGPGFYNGMVPGFGPGMGPGPILGPGINPQAQTALNPPHFQWEHVHPKQGENAVESSTELAQHSEIALLQPPRIPPNPIPQNIHALIPVNANPSGGTNGPSAGRPVVGTVGSNQSVQEAQGSNAGHAVGGEKTADQDLPVQKNPPPAREDLYGKASETNPSIKISSPGKMPPGPNKPPEKPQPGNTQYTDLSLMTPPERMGHSVGKPGSVPFIPITPHSPFSPHVIPDNVQSGQMERLPLRPSPNLPQHPSQRIPTPAPTMAVNKDEGINSKEPFPVDAKKTHGFKFDFGDIKPEELPPGLSSLSKDYMTPQGVYPHQEFPAEPQIDNPVWYSIESEQQPVESFHPAPIIVPVQPETTPFVFDYNMWNYYTVAHPSRSHFNPDGSYNGPEWNLPPLPPEPPEVDVDELPDNSHIKLSNSPQNHDFHRLEEKRERKKKRSLLHQIHSSFESLILIFSSATSVCPSVRNSLLSNIFALTLLNVMF